MGDNDSDGTFLASAAGKPAELASILAGRITAGQYPPGTRLPSERELAATFRVSRGTVRDAVAILAQRHVVRTKWGAGTIVLDTDEASLAIETVLRQADHERGNIRELRDLVEPPMAALAARRASPSDLVTLHGIIDHTDIRMTPRESLRMDMAFHLALAESTGNPLLAALLRFVNDSAEATRAGTHSTVPRRRVSLDGHRAIFARVQAGDAPGAQQAMLDHLRAIGGMDVLGIQPQQPAELKEPTKPMEPAKPMKPTRQARGER